MRIDIVLGTAPLAATIVAPAAAQQTQTYVYDVHGRLTATTRATGSNNQTTIYVLDKADNRASRTTGAVASGATTPQAAHVDGERQTSSPDSDDAKPSPPSTRVIAEFR